MLTEVAVTDIAEYEAGLFEFLDTNPDGSDVMKTIRETGKLEAETEEKMKNVLKAYTDSFLSRK